MTTVSLRDCIGPAFYDLHKQLKTDNSITQVILKGGRGSLKSSFVSVEIILGIIADKEANAAIFMRHDNMLRDAVFEQLVWAINKLGVSHLFNTSVSPMRITYKPTGQRIIFKGADKPINLKGIKIALGYIKYTWFEEADLFGGMEAIRKIIQSTFRGEDHGEQRVSFLSYNPPKSARSWLNQEYKIAKPGRIVHHSDYTQAPPSWLGKVFIAEAEHLKSVNESAYNHEYLGHEIGTGLEIFNNITARVISQEEIDSFDYIFQGIDFGYSVDPLSFVRLAYNRKMKRIYIFYERYGIQYKYSKLANDIPAEYKRHMTYADSSAPRDIAELKSDHGFKILPAKKPKGSVDSGIKWLRDLEEIIIDPVRCPETSKEFTNYALDVRKDGTIIESFPDKDNHAIDAVRYALFDHMLSNRKMSAVKKHITGF